MKIRFDFFVIMIIILLVTSAVHLTISSTMIVSPRKISSFTPAESYSFVRVVGTVSDSPSINVENGVVDSIYFKVDDGSGSATVKIYAPLAGEMYEDKKIPSLGDYVDVSGIVKVTDTSVSITVYAEEDLHFEPQKPIKISIDEANNYDEGDAVEVEGRIYEINAYSFGYIIAMVDFSSGSMINLSVPYNYEIPDIKELSHSEIKVVGAIHYYKGIAEIVPRVFGGISLKNVLEYQKIENLQNLTLYSYVYLEGEVDYIISSDSYQLFVLDVAGDRIDVYVESGANATKVWLSDIVAIKGIVSIYGGELEIKVRAYSADYVEVIS